MGRAWWQWGYCNSSLVSLQGLQLTKEQLNSVADGGSLKTALTAENSHQVQPQLASPAMHCYL